MKTIKSKRDFEKVFKAGRRLSHPLLRIRVLHHDEGGTAGQVAFVAPKRLGNAPVRNRGKRVLREAARACGLPLQGYSVIMLATDQTAASKEQDVEKARVYARILEACRPMALPKRDLRAEAASRNQAQARLFFE